jgi:hypothetical protein
MSAPETEKSRWTMAEGAAKLLPLVTCPHCWERFAPEHVHWVSEHVDLLGDPLLGPERQQRFLPSRFTLEGEAIDARGMTCRNLACPRCHLLIPRSMLEVEPFFVSILGAPASGKSYFLTAMTWQLRQVMPLDFKVAFTDAEPAANRILNDCEESLFLNANWSKLIPLGNLIRKTELQGELYDTVAYGQQLVSYPRPFLFSVQPQEGHPGGGGSNLERMLCLYDNAGEHFLPGHDTASSPVTRHLAQSRALLFLFDPMQDPRFRAAADSHGPGRREHHQGRSSRQETLFIEAAARIRRHAGMSARAKYERPIIIVLPKFDEWSHVIEQDIDTEPWRIHGGVAGLDLERIEHVSGHLRQMLMQYCPEMVIAADTFAQSVTYIAVTSLGNSVELDAGTGLPGIRPMNVKPAWVVVPLLFALSRVLPALVPRIIRKRA